MTILHSNRQISSSYLLMDGSTSLTSIISRSTAIKSILLTAWRAKLSNEEWEAKIRKVLPRGVNGDIYDLAECLLRQALVGPVPNHLFISYLKHAVKCGLVSYGSVLGSIANQTIPNRSSSIICLLEFLKTFRDQLSCTGSEIDCLNLCNSLSKLIFWLLKCVNQCLASIDLNSNGNHQGIIPSQCLTNTSVLGNNGFGYNNNNQPSTMNNDYHNNMTIKTSTTNSLSHNEIILGIIDLCAEAILDFVGNPFTKSLLFLSTVEYGETFDSIERLLKNIQETLSNFTQQTSNVSVLMKNSHNVCRLQELNINFKSREMHPSILASGQLKCIQMNRTRSTLIATSAQLEKTRKSLQENVDSATNYALFNSLYALVGFDALIRPARSHQLLARQIATITNFNSATISMTYCELIRVCLVGLVESIGSTAKPLWAFFTFIKLPRLLLELGKVYTHPLVINNDLNIPLNPSENYNSNQNTKFVDDLKKAIERLCEYSPLLDGAEHKYSCDLFKYLVRELLKKDPGLVALKTIDFKKFPTKRVPVISDYHNGIHAVTKTDQIFSSLFRSFDQPTNLFDLFTVFVSMVHGSQFDLINIGAAASGRLELFVKKLVEQNELNMISQSDKDPYTQSLMFDITFLTLTIIANRYGSEMIGSESNRTFERWFIECHDPKTRINCPKEVIKNYKEDIVNDLLKQLTDPNEQGLRMDNVNWHEVCFNIPKVMSEILNAIEQNYLSEEQVLTICDRLKSKMCSVAVVAANWLQSYIRILSEAERGVPLFILYNLTKISSSEANQPKQPNGNVKNVHLLERSSLMRKIIKLIYFEFSPKDINAPPSQYMSLKNQQQQQQNLNDTSNIDPVLKKAKLSNQSHLVHDQSKENLANNIDSIGSESHNRKLSTTAISNETNSNSDQPTNSTDQSSHSENNHFISLMSTQDLFLANVKECLNRGWIDHRSLRSMTSLFDMIGSECFTNLVVDHVLTSHESPSDLARAVNISFGIFHLDLNACSVALLNETVPNWLMVEKKQILMNQPRAHALAHLTVMTIIEEFNNLKTTQMMHPDAFGSSKNAIKLNLLNGYVAKLLKLFSQIMSDKIMSHKTLFPLLFLQQTVVCAREDASIITSHLQPEILLDIIDLFSSELTYELVLAISNLSDPKSRQFAAKATCELAIRHATRNR